MLKTLIPYPNQITRWIFRAPVLMYRLGLGWLAGVAPFLILTTIGRKTHRIRYTALEYRRHGSKFYVVSGWGQKADWFRNLMAHPCATVKIGRQSYSVRASLVDEHAELLSVLYMFRHMLALLDNVPSPVTLKTLAEVADKFTIVRLDIADERPALPAVPADRAWIWPTVLACGLLVGAVVEFLQPKAQTRGDR